jgi:phage-related protein
VRDRGEQVLEDLERARLDFLARDFGLTEERLNAYGAWLASLAPWTHFITLTHDPRRLGAGHSIVGRQRHRRVLSKWVFDDVRRLDEGARWFSEMELQKSGQAHEHGLLAASSTAPVLSMRQAWFERAGYCDVRTIDRSEAEGIGRAMYVAKYTGKATAVEPFIVGFGLHRVASHSLTLEGIR